MDTSDCYVIDLADLPELLSTEKQLVKVIDLLGRETIPQKNKVLIYIFSDGTSRRIFEAEY